MKSRTSTVPAALHSTGTDASGAKPRYLTPEQLLHRWEGVVVAGTLANWRSRTLQGKPTGPAFQKLGRAVRYRVEDVEAYERLNFSGQQGE